MAKTEDLIAVFDSGQGGISVLRELVRQMPREHFLYFGDSANAPYGSRPTQQVRELTLDRIAMLMQRGLKAVVVACNTATGATIDELRSRYPHTIIIGIEPALKLAAEQSTKGRIVVMATEVTLREKKFSALMQRYQGSHDIVPLPCPKIVEFVERGVLEGPEPEAYLREVLLPCLNADTRAIVLGCTHFPFMRPLIARLAGPNIRIYDGGEGTAAQTRRRLEQENLLLSEGEGRVIIENSLPDPKILALSRMLLHFEENGL
ncbi:MAG: glutamate racemase [Ruminococcaceae bacterium]|nr:glutamate racemase [Oscillospiraceae bacterium]